MTAMADEDDVRRDKPEGHAPGADAGGRAHTATNEPHPAGDGPRTDRQVGGPVAEKGAAEALGHGKGTGTTRRFESHR
jgi:hypothetical protein